MIVLQELEHTVSLCFVLFFGLTLILFNKHKYVLSTSHTYPQA